MATRTMRAPSARRHKPAPRRKRSETSTARREAILAAALDEFSARGFAAARLDDVARRAGVAKGTIYLHFRHKAALFQDLVPSVISPLIARFATPVALHLPPGVAPP